MESCFSESCWRDSKGQAALEYMIIVAVALALLAPLVSVSQDMLGDLSDSRRTVLLSETMDSIEEAIRRVESQGEPAKITLDVEVPSRVVSAGVEEKYFFYVMDVRGRESDYYRTTGSEIDGELPVDEGLHRISVENRGDVVYVDYE